LLAFADFFTGNADHTSIEQVDRCVDTTTGQLTKAGFLRNFENKYPDFFKTFYGLFPDLTFPYDLSMSNEGMVIFNTIYVKI